jgi:hypothetical protein
VPGRWFEKSYRRTETSLHIPQCDESFLSKFDPDEYVGLLELANVDAACFFAKPMSGEVFWPTAVGPAHACLRGRELVGDVLERCHAKGIGVILYFAVIFDHWAWTNHPDWRIVDVDGRRPLGFTDRCGIVCPNSPYRDFVAGQLADLASRYEFEGLWADMETWATVCYCEHCLGRFADEVGGEPPRTVNWRDPAWVRFQRKREEWLADFARLVRETIQSRRPETSVNHQGSPFKYDWTRAGASLELARQNDFLNHDFYGDALEQSFHCKLFSKLGESPRFEYITPRTMGGAGPVFQEPTTTKPVELLKAQAFSVLAHHGAFRIYDDAYPDGTFDRRVYETMGEVFRETERYEEFLGGEPCWDVAVYLNFESGVDMTVAGAKPTEVAPPPAVSPVHEVPPRSAMNLAKTLIEAHVPFGVVTKRNLGELDRHRVVVLPNLAMMDEEEAGAFRAFVEAGGGLYASKWTSLFSKSGEAREDFLLADLLGVSFEGEMKEGFSYVAPTGEGEALFGPYTARDPMCLPASQLLVRAHEGSKVLATVTPPVTDPADTTCYGQVHLNPPGATTGQPALVYSERGKGRAVYAAGVVEGLRHDPQRRVMAEIVRLLAGGPFSFELAVQHGAARLDAPKPVEMTLFHQPERKRFLANLLNFQGELPNVPVEGLHPRVRLGPRRPRRVLLLPEGKELPFETRDGFVEFPAPRLETFLMFAVDYE